MPGGVVSATVDAQGHLILPDEFVHGNALESGSSVSMLTTPEGMLVRAPLSQLRRVYIEPTVRCNLSCRTCMRNAWDEPMGDMSPATFSRALAALAEQRGVVSCFFGGLGEPLMHPDIAEMVEQAAQVACKTELITNGLLLDSRLSGKLIEAGLCTLWISLDGASPEGYADVRMSDALCGVLQNISSYRDQHRRLKGTEPDIGVVFVAMKRNFKELPALVRQSVRLGISRYLVTNVLPYTPEMCREVLYRRSVDTWTADPSPWNPSIRMPDIDVDPATSETLLKMRGLWPGGMADYRYRCPFVEQRSTSLAWDGGVSPCLALMHAHTSYLFDMQRSVQRYQLGNVNDRSLTEIWRSDEYTRFRQKVEEFDFPPCTVCASCEMAEANQEDCFGNTFPTCGGCLWAKGLIQCP